MNIEDKNTTPPDNEDRKTRMNKFFEEMQQKIEAEAKPKTSNPSPKIDPQVTEELDADIPVQPVNKQETPQTEEKKPSFLDGLKEIKEELDPIADKAMNDLFDSAKSFYSKAEEKAKDAWGKFDKYTDDLEEKMRKEDEAYEEKKRKRPFKHDAGGSLFEGTGSFFDKAEKFAKGDFDEIQKKKNEGEMTILPPDKPKKKKIDPNEKVYGFEDLDGDGDPIIDDAILDEEDDK